MKNIVKLFGIIAFVAVIVFSMAACGDDGGGDNGDDKDKDTVDYTGQPWIGTYARVLSYNTSTYILKVDGKAEYNNGSSSYTFNYRVDSDRKFYFGSRYTGDFNENYSQLTTDDSPGENIFIKQP